MVSFAGIEQGTKFEDVPETWKCPICNVNKNEFEEYEE